MTGEGGDMVDIIIENLEYPEEWGSEFKVKLKTWLRKYYSENPPGGKVLKDLEDLIDAIYLSENSKKTEGDL